MKKILSIILVLVLVFSLAACGSGGGNATPTPGVAGNATPAPSDGGGAIPATDDGGVGGYTGGEYNLKIGTYFSAQQGGGQYAQKFSDRVKELSDGKIVIDVHQDSSLGNQTELTESLANGTIDFSPNDWPMMDTVLGYSKGAIVGFPFIFNDWDHVQAFYESEAMEQMKAELLENYGIRCIGSAADGFRQVYSQKAINSVEDFKGLKIRLPDISVYIETFQALGAATQIVNPTEIYTSLQSGIVNALERPADGMYNNNLYEQTSYVVKTNHIWVDVNLFISEITFQKLDEAAQAVILQAGEEVSAEHFEQMRQQDTDSLNALITECDQELIELDTTEMKQICVDAVWPKFLANIEGGQGIVDIIQGLS